MSDEWGPWIEHDGKGCPCRGAMVEAVSMHGLLRGATVISTNEHYEGAFIAGCEGGLSWDWANWPRYAKVLRYRIRKPKGLAILEGILADLPDVKSPEKVGGAQ